MGVGVPHVIRAVDLARMCLVWGAFTDAVRCSTEAGLLKWSAGS